jgi:dehydrogenase/reductase SDR family protein 4
MDEETYDMTFEVNVKSVFFFAKEALDLLKKSRDGANILVTSSLSAFMPSKMIGVYAMGKAALVNMVKFLAVELLDSNIRVNLLYSN